MKPVLEFLNDYRDTIWYGFGVIVAVLIGIFFDVGAAFNWIMLIIWREACRDIAWIKNPHPRIDALVVVRLTSIIMCGVNCLCLCIFIAIDLLHGNYAFTWWLWPVFLLNGLGFAHGLKPFRSIRFALKIYWVVYFDWPRKQKPPKQRIKQALGLVKKLLAKIANAIPKPIMPTPEPNPCRVRL